MAPDLDHLPRVRITFLPTPPVEMRRLAQALGGPRLFVKRDDMTGLGMGGNKTRKLEFLLGEALQLAGRHEGLLLDPVYTGRAMGALIDMIRKGEFTPNETVLFWHTGGTPALFGYAQELYPASSQ